MRGEGAGGVVPVGAVMGVRAVPFRRRERSIAALAAWVAPCGSRARGVAFAKLETVVAHWDVHCPDRPFAHDEILICATSTSQRSLLGQTTGIHGGQKSRLADHLL
jgi:hypothetical protein